MGWSGLGSGPFDSSRHHDYASLTSENIHNLTRMRLVRLYRGLECPWNSTSDTPLPRPPPRPASCPSASNFVIYASNLTRMRLVSAFVVAWSAFRIPQLFINSTSVPPSSFDLTLFFFSFPAFPLF
jgi:hypothetical protein